MECNTWQLREQNKESREDVGLALPSNSAICLERATTPGETKDWWHSPSPFQALLPAPPSTWHRDPGEGLRLAQRVHLDVPERLAHGALQVPATQEDAGEPLRPLGG